MQNELLTLTGEIRTVIYENEENGYKVAEVEGQDDLFIAVGYMYGVSEGESVKLTGKWVSHRIYGEQFSVEVYEKTPPATEKEICRYLGSGIIKGVREATARKIVDFFGEDTLNVIENEPLKLTQIRGISAEKALIISRSYIHQMGASSLMMFLQQYDISANMCAKIYKKFGAGAVELIKENPYILCDEIEGLGFKTVDRLAASLGGEPEDKNRVCAGVLYAQRTNTLFGHTFLPREMLISAAASILRVSNAQVDDAIDELVLKKRLVSEKERESEHIYYFTHYHAEKYCAERICDIAAVGHNINEDNISRQISIIESRRGITLAQMQKKAVFSAMENSALVITGGPGTGKTTIINTIIDIMEANGLRVVLAAPTGRAAKRMSQVCDRPAKTIHRLLEAGYNDGEPDLVFGVNESNPISADVIIVDEMSMVDILLMNSLMHAIVEGTRLIMVGDVDQLPSVGAGNVLRDIIESGIVSVIRLTEIFRQAEKSRIIVNAHRINNGEYPILNEKGGDFFFADLPDASDGAAYITSLCMEKLPSRYGISSSDIQVLAPGKKGVAGVVNLNEILQRALNPPDNEKEERPSGNMVYREGDRVMQIRNNYDISWKGLDNIEEGTGVFNGDVGYIEEISNTAKTVTVVYEDKRVRYNFKELDEIELAYAVTVHKSQGSGATRSLVKS